MVDTDKSNTILAREYLRVSVDRSGRERSPAEQHADNQRHADTRKWTLGQPYRDIGSASKFAKKGRAGFDNLIEDLEHGRFGADILILWESSRGTRRMSEAVRLIELCEDNSVQIYVTADSKLYDPAEPRDRKALLEDGIDSEYESAKTSKRATRNRAADAVDGRPNGPCPFGYRRTYDPLTGRLDKQLPEETEAAVIKELFDRLHGGHSLRSIALDFEARGIRSRTGKVFSAQYLRALAMTRAYVGEREHEAGKRGRRRTGQATFHKAMWPALVSRSKYFGVQQILTDPKRVTIRPGRAKHLLSMIALCDVCSGPLCAKRTGQPNAIYICLQGGHVSVPYDELNDFVQLGIVAYITRPDNLSRLAASDDGEVEKARSAVAELETELRELAARVGRGELSQEFAAMAEPGMRARLKLAQAHEIQLATPSALARFVGPDGDFEAAWKGAPISARRELARQILTPELLGEVRVMRSLLNRTHVPIEDRVRWSKEQRGTTGRSAE